MESFEKLCDDQETVKDFGIWEIGCMLVMAVKRQSHQE